MHWVCTGVIMQDTGQAGLSDLSRTAVSVVSYNPGEGATARTLTTKTPIAFQTEIGPSWCRGSIPYMSVNQYLDPNELSFCS